MCMPITALIYTPIALFMKLLHFMFVGGGRSASLCVWLGVV